MKFDFLTFSVSVKARFLRKEKGVRKKSCSTLIFNPLLSLWRTSSPMVQ